MQSASFLTSKSNSIPILFYTFLTNFPVTMLLSFDQISCLLLFELLSFELLSQIISYWDTVRIAHISIANISHYIAKTDNFLSGLSAQSTTCERYQD